MSVLKQVVCVAVALVNSACALVQSPAERTPEMALSSGFSRIEPSAGSLRAYLRWRDTICLVSIASPLDTAAWTRAIGVSPLRISLNPLDHTAALIEVPQTHFTGARDAVVPPATIARFIVPMKKAQVIARSEFDRDCCWVRDWRELLRQSCLRAP